MSTPQPAARTSAFARLRQPIEPKRGPKKQSVGGLPQVSLLPSEIREAGSVARTRRRLGAVVVLAAVAAVGVVALASTVDSAAQERLTSASAQAATLRGQIAKFSDVKALEQRIKAGEAAVTVGGSTLIDWDAQLSAIEADMPSGYTVTSISATGATPLTDYPQGTTPLEPRRAATVTMTITSSSSGDELSTWLRKLRDIPAYADATASVSSSDGLTTTTLTVHLTAKAIVAADGKESK